MRMDVSPDTVQLRQGIPAVFAITVTNPRDIICGAVVRILGADPAWVELSADRVSLFPGESTTVVVTLRPPAGLPAGSRRIVVQVREVTPPESVLVSDVVLEVPAAEEVALRVEPLLVQAGKKAAFGLVVENRGNTEVDATLRGSDEEEHVTFVFQPSTVHLAPGEHVAVELEASARRRFAGSPHARPLLLFADRRTPDETAAGVPIGDPLARATFFQRAVVGRGLLSLLGLLVAVSVFATVITLALGSLVSRSAADRDLALQVAAARDQVAGAGTASVSGTVLELNSTSTPVPGVTVQLYPAADLSAPLASTATDDKGMFTLAGLSAGSYKVRYIGAGFAEIWFPGALSGNDATAVTLSAGQKLTGLDVRIGGLPASIAGSVVGEDVSASTVSLTCASTSDTCAGALVKTVPVGSDGSFTITNIPSPATYDLVVTKPGFAATSQQVDLGGGEARSGIELRLVRGDGEISGTVTAGGQGLGQATITATFGQTVATAVSQNTTGNVGAFVLRGLPTPSQFTLVVSGPPTGTKYGSQTVSVGLAAGAAVTGLRVDLTPASGSLSGRVTTPADTTQGAGVTVTVSNGTTTLTTVTQNTAAGGRPIGSWQLSGLPLPSTYSVTFSRPGLTSQTLSLALDAGGNISQGPYTNGAVSAVLTPSTGTLTGTVLQVPTGGTTAQPKGEVTVTVTDGTTTYRTTTASVTTPKQPSGSWTTGSWVVSGLKPGTYTVSASALGTRPTTVRSTLSAGEVKPVPLTLATPAKISGRVTLGGQPAVNALVVLYLATGYPGTAVTQVATGADGSYSITDVAAPENYVVEVQLPAGSPSATKNVTTAPSVTSTIDFALPARP